MTAKQEEQDEGCFATTFERKYYSRNGAFVKRSLQPREFRTGYRGLHIPRLNKERLMNEAESLRFIRSHTDIPVPTVYCDFQDDEAYYLITEYVEGVGMSELAEDQKATVREELQQNVVVNPETLRINAIVDWEYAGFFPPRFEWPFFNRLGPSVAIHDEIDDASSILEFLTSQRFIHSPCVCSQVAEIDGYFASSTSSDEVVRDKFGQTQDLLELLSASDRVLMDYVPSSRRMDIAEPLKPVIGRLRGAYNDVLRLESRRRKKVEALRDKCRNDDIKPEILKEAARLERTYPTTAIAPAHFEDFFERRLDKLYEPELEAVEKEDAEQERMMTEIERVNREFESQRKSSIGGNREREQALQRLDNAYYKYKEIVNHLDVGRKFYNDLSKVVGQNFRDPVKVWVSERRIDAKSLEEELSMPPLGSLSMNRTPVASPPVSSYQAEQQQHANSYFGSNAGPAANTHAQRQHQQVHSPPAEAHVQSWAGSTVEPQQPQPVPPVSNMWTPDMGIRFGGPAGGHGAAAPAGAGQHANPQGPRQPSGGTWDPNSGIRFG
ncbi:hypothetical protein BN1708_000200 [Verticillium longisporum]|uniref:ALIX V-shaped domain-containing protein n=1 Tax=Verticillium longisporum TaxID=100787 RepID=A0A0G4KD21_VERLO|nr:hypothetical protein BN1708_000200 [Verticillium longisporum]